MDNKPETPLAPPASPAQPSQQPTPNPSNQVFTGDAPKMTHFNTGKDTFALGTQPEAQKVAEKPGMTARDGKMRHINAFSKFNAPKTAQPSSDIVLVPDAPGQKANLDKKKLLIIGGIVAGVLLFGGIILALILSRGGSNKKDTANYSAELKTRFMNLASLVISGDSSTELALSASTADWQISKAVNRTMTTPVKTYVEELTVANSDFSNASESYFNNVTAVTENTDTEKLKDDDRALNEKVTALSLFLGMDTFIEGLPAKYSANPSMATTFVTSEISPELEISDKNSANLIASLTFYYQTVIRRLQLLDANGCIVNGKVDSACLVELSSNQEVAPSLQNLDSSIVSFINDVNSYANLTVTELVPLFDEIDSILRRMG